MFKGSKILKAAGIAAGVAVVIIAMSPGNVGPLFALDAIRVTLAAKHEAQTATAAQLEELAQSPS